MEDQAVLDWYLECRAAALVENLEKRNFKAQYCATGEDAKSAFLALIPEGASVALTGSQTLDQIGVKPYLRASGKYNLFDPYEPGIEKAESIARRKKGLTADVLISSTNAITEDGVLVNVDGMGNRVAGMIFGPDKVVLAISMNKVVKDVPSAMDRLRMIAGPMNNKRLELPNPCTKTGFCQDCKSPSRICNYYSIIERSFIPERMHIVLIGHPSGY